MIPRCMGAGHEYGHRFMSAFWGCRIVEGKDHAPAAVPRFQYRPPMMATPAPPTKIEQVMAHPSVPMHGPEHHFLAPAVLVAMLATALPTGAATRSSANYSVLAEVLDGGGGLAQSAGYGLTASVEPFGTGTSLF